MLIEKKSTLTGRMNSMDIPITPEQVERINDRFETKELIQDIVPELDKPLREFLISGATPDEWDAMSGEVNVRTTANN